jgi:TPR repeat protein
MTQSIRAVAIVLIATLSWGAAFAQESPESSIPPLIGAAIAPLAQSAAKGDAAAAFVLGGYFSGADRTVSERAEGLRLLVQAADAGLTEAKVRAADVLRSGSAGSTDLARAAAYYAEAAADGDDGARRSLAGLHLDGKLDMFDVPKAIGLLEDATAEGDITAAIMLANILANGTLVPQDGERARLLLLRGILAGNNGAYAALGDLYRRGAAGLPADPAMAFAYFEALVARGDRGAIRRVADLRARGEGVAKDIPAAVAMLEAAARDGDVQSYLQLADLFARGELTPIDGVRAISYLESAAAMGSTDASVRLGDIYRDGIAGVARDAAKALAAYSQATPRDGDGPTVGLVRLGDLYRNGTVVPLDLSKAMAFYEQAAGHGDNNARRNLASMLLDGRSAAINPARAAALLEEAARAGDSNAAMQLGGLMSDGNLLTADYDRTVEFFTMAERLGDRRARVRLATALVDGPLSRQHQGEGVSLLSQGVAERLPGAATALGRLILQLKVPGSTADDGLGLLESAAMAGDADAARYLLSIYRDGMGSAVRPSPARAQALLGALQGIVSPQLLAVEQILLAAKADPQPSALEQIAASFALLDRNDGGDVLRQLSRSNQNAYLFLLQTRLKEMGFYDGPATGVLSGGTMDAFLAACAEAKEMERCDRGPLTDDAVRFFSSFNYSAPPAP